MESFPVLIIKGDLCSKQALMLVFQGKGPNQSLERALWLNFVKAVEHAVSEYQFAYKLSKNLSFQNRIRCGGHLETCITVMVRAIDLGRSFRNKINSKYKEDVIKKPKCFSNDIYDQLKFVRNLIAHTSDALENDGIIKGDSIMLELRDKNGILTFGQHKIALEDLKNWLADLYKSADEIIEYSENK